MNIKKLNEDLQATLENNPVDYYHQKVVDKYGETPEDLSFDQIAVIIDNYKRKLDVARKHITGVVDSLNIAKKQNLEEEKYKVLHALEKIKDELDRTPR